MVFQAAGVNNKRRMKYKGYVCSARTIPWPCGRMAKAQRGMTHFGTGAGCVATLVSPLQSFPWIGARTCYRNMASELLSLLSARCDDDNMTKYERDRGYPVVYYRCASALAFSFTLQNPSYITP